MPLTPLVWPSCAQPCALPPFHLPSPLPVLLGPALLPRMENHTPPPPHADQPWSVDRPPNPPPLRWMVLSDPLLDRSSLLLPLFFLFLWLRRLQFWDALFSACRLLLFLSLSLSRPDHQSGDIL